MWRIGFRFRRAYKNGSGLNHGAQSYCRCSLAQPRLDASTRLDREQLRLPVDGEQPITEPGRRRVYSNTGIERAAQLLEQRAEMPFTDYLAGAVARPLALRGRLLGSPAHGWHGPLDDLLALGRELLAPTLVAAETLAEATMVQFPGLVGVLPGLGRMEPNDWGLTFELRDAKSPHWTGSRNSARTFGHFGASGTFLWVDPEVRLACGVLTGRPFGDWAKAAWPALSDAVLAEAG